MPEAENHALPPATNDTWRTWLMTGARRAPIDRRRVRGAHKGLKKMLVEGMSNGDDRPHAWKDFSGAMIRHAVDAAMRSLPSEDKQVVKLAYFGGMSNRDIAREVGLTEATVQRRLRRALATISEQIQRGRVFSRRAMYAIVAWLSGRWLSDTAHQFAQVGAVAAAAAIIASQPAPLGGTAQGDAHAPAAAKAHTVTAVPLVPSPTSATVAVPSYVRAIQLPVAVPVPVPSVSIPPLPPPPSPPVNIKPGL